MDVKFTMDVNSSEQPYDMDPGEIRMFKYPTIYEDEYTSKLLINPLDRMLHVQQAIQLSEIRLLWGGFTTSLSPGVASTAKLRESIFMFNYIFLDITSSRNYITPYFFGTCDTSNTSPAKLYGNIRDEQGAVIKTIINIYGGSNSLNTYEEGTYKKTV